MGHRLTEKTIHPSCLRSLVRLTREEGGGRGSMAGIRDALTSIGMECVTFKMSYACTLSQAKGRFGIFQKGTQKPPFTSLRDT